MTSKSKTGPEKVSEPKEGPRWEKYPAGLSIGLELELGVAVGNARSAIELAGNRVSQSTDFDLIASRLKSEANWELNQVGSPLENELSSANAYYIIVESPDGDIVGFCSVRIHTVGKEKLSGFLANYYRRIYGAGEPAIAAEELPPPALRASGTIGFVSDLHIDQRQTGRFSSSSLMMLALSTCAMKFDPELIYGFISDRQVKRGLGARYLVPGLYPAALHWLVDPPWDPKDWMLCVSREEYRYLFRKYPILMEPSVNRALSGVRD